MTEVRRINPEAGVVREILDLRKRVQNQETRASGNIVVRETLKTTDPETGVATIVGQLPDGSYGIQPFVYDITPPPVASTPIVSAVPGVISVTWDGQFVNGELAPKDFTRLNIMGHKMDGTSTVATFVVGEIFNASNIVYFSSDVIPVGETWTFSFESEDYNTNRAEWSTRSAPVTMLSVVTDASVNEALEGIRTEVETAQTAASDAQTAADDAQQAADDAAQSAQAASNLASGKNKVHYGTTQPPLTGNTVGDMWVDVDDSYALYSWSGSAWVKTQDTQEALDLAGTKIRSFVQASQPTATAVGDIWMDTDNKNELFRWNGSAWISYRDLTIADADAKAATAIANAATAKDIADGKVASYFQPGQPTGQVAGDAGDLWFDTDDGNKMYRWTGSAWVVADDQRIAATVTAAANAKQIADSKITTFYQASAPSSTGRTVGDLWVDTDDQNKLYRWNGASWDSARDLSIASASNAAATALEAAQAAQSAAETAQATADGSIRTFYQSEAPTGLNSTTNVGDLWFDTDTNQAHRWNGTTWLLIQDNAIATALQKAQDAQTTADGKITSYYQPGQPTTGEVGDLWFDTDDKNKPYYCSSASPVTWTQVRDGSIADAQSTANTALTSANGKNKTYYQTSKPTGGTYILGDTWVDTDDGNKLYVHNGTDFVNAQDGAIGAASTLAASKGKTIIQSAEPSVADRLIQNLWIDTTNNLNTPKRWNTSTNTWTAITDKVATDAATAAVNAQTKADQAFNNAAAAATAAGNAQTTADGKNRVWYQTTAPAGTAHKDGDLWFDTDDGNKLYLWKAGTTNAWTVFQDAAIGLAQQAANNAATAASNAQTTANNAQTAAATADSKAVTAKGVADQAVADALAAQQDADQALTDALNASNLAATKGKVLYQTTAPTGVDANAQTLWIDTTNGANTPKRWVSGTTWVTVTDKVATDAAALASTKGKILFQTTAPTGADASALTLWIDTTNGANTPKRWVSGTTWAAITDKVALDAATAAANAATAASNAQGTANTAVQDAANASTLAQQAFNNAASASTAAGNAQTTADSKNRVWYQDEAPTGTGHKINDIWFDTNDGNKPYRWTGSAWVVAQDAAIATAQSKADSAFSVANGKNTTYYQTTQPSGGTYIKGDLWFDTDANYKLYTYSGSIWQATQDAAAAQAAAISAAASDATTKANAAQQAAITAAAADATAKADAAKAAALTAVQNAENKIVNGSFELDFDGWTKSNNSHAIDTTVARTGTKSYVTQGGGELTQPGFPVVVGSTWRYEWFYKTQDTFVQGSAGGLRLQKSTDGGVTYSDAASTGITVSADWRYQSAEYVVPAGVTHLRARVAYAYTAGPKVWMDDIRLIDVSQIKALEADAQAKADAAKTAAIAAAATDATTKANAAQAAAISAAAADATAKAQQAEADAAATAAADATAKADAAEQAAIDAAAITAQLKADNAEQAAIDAAAADAAAKADAAEQAAIDAAALDATAKAEAAEAAAAADASAKANAARDAAIEAAAADATAKVATKNASYYQPAQPSGGTYKQGDLWFDTDDGYKLYTYTGSAWQGTQDAARAKSEAITAAATDAATKAATAKSEAIAAAASDATTKATNAQTAAISAAATDATTKMETAQRVAIDSMGYSKNPSFEDWTGTYPASYGAFNTAPTKETTTVLTGKNAARFNCTDATTQRGLTFHSALAHAPYFEYLTVELDVYLASGTSFGGAGVLVDWNGLTGGNRVTLSLASEIPTPVTGKWYRVVKVIRKPTAATGTFTNYSGWLMGQYSSGMGTMSVKDVIFDWINVRPATTEEITSFGLPATVTTLTNTVNTKTRTYYQATSPGTTGNTAGDLWFDTANGNKPYVWVAGSTNAWTSSQDASIATAQTTATNAQTAANGKNKVVWSTLDASGTTGYTAGDIWFKRDASGTVLAQWEFTTSWQARPLNEAIIPNLTAGKITAGTFSGDRIGVNSIDASKLTIGDFTNLADDPDFEIGTGWSSTAQASIQSISVGVEGQPTKALRIIANGTLIDVQNKNVIPVLGGDKIYGSIHVKSDSVATAGDVHFATTVTLADGTKAYPMFEQKTATSITGSWTTLKGVATMPANAVSMQIRVSVRNNVTAGTFYFDHAIVRRQNTAVTIADGTIAAGSLIVANGAIGNAQIADLNADKITAGIIATARLSAESIRSKLIEADYLVATDIFAPNSITSASGIFGTMDASVINAGTIAAARLDAEVVKSKLIDASFINAADIFAQNSITSASGIFGTMDASVINAGTIGADRLDANTIRSKLIEADYLVATDIFAPNSVTSASGIFGTMDASVINAGTIAAARLDAEVVRSKLIDATDINAVDIIAQNSITATNGLIASLDASKITVGTLAAARIGAKSIGVDKLLVQGSDNLIVEGDFGGQGASWDLPAGIVINATAGRNSLPAMVITNNATLQTSFNVAGVPKVAIESLSDATNAYRVSMWVKSSVTAPANGVLLNARFRSTTGTYTTQSVAYTTGTPPVAATFAANTWVEITGVVTAPANTISVAFSVSTAAAFSTGVVTIDQVMVARAATGELIVDGSVTATKMAANSITATNGIIQSIDAAKITAGEMSGSRIAAKSILANRLVISSTDNLIVEADFSNNGTSWGTLDAIKSINATAGRGTLPALRVTGTTTAQTINNLTNKIPVGQEDRFRGSFYVKSNAALGTNTVRLGLRAYTTATANTAITIAQNSAPLVANTWTLVEGYSPALPAGTIAIEFYLYVVNNATGTVTDIDYAAVTRAADGKLVVDGAIDGKTITGALFQTTNTINSGIKIDGNGFKAYNSITGDQTVNIDPITGLFASSGNFSTESIEAAAAQGTMTIVATFGSIYKPNHTDFSYQPGIEFTRTHSAQGEQTPASISYDGKSIILNTYPEYPLTQANFVPDEGGAYLAVGDSGVTLSAQANGSAYTDWIKYPTMHMTGNQDSPALGLMMEYTAPDWEFRQTGVESNEYGRGALDYGNPEHMFSHLFHRNNTYDAADLSSAYVSVGTGGIWGIKGTLSNGTVGTALYSNQWDEDGHLGIYGANKITFGSNPNGSLGDHLVLDSTKAEFKRPVDAPSYTIDGAPMSSGEVQVWDASGTVAAATVPVPRIQTFSHNGIDSTSSELSTSGTGFITIQKDGVYDIHWSYGQSGGTNQDRNFLEIKTDGMNIPIARNSFANGEDSAIAAASGVKLAVGQKLYFEVYQNGSSRTFNSKIRIKRTAAPVPTAGYQTGDISHTGNFTVTGDMKSKPRFAQFQSLGFGISGGNNPWDSGPVSEVTAKSSGNDFAVAGPYAGSVSFTKSGWYQISHFMIPQSGAPGGSWARLFLGSTAENLVQNGNGPAAEIYLSTVPIYIAAGDYVRSTVVAPNYWVANTVWKIAKMPWG